MCLIRSVWEGVFSSFEEAGGDLDVFEGDIWINKQKVKLEAALRDLDSGSVCSKDYPLSTVVAMLLGGDKKIRILDFGGGGGIQYIELIAKVPLAQQLVEYVIVDNPKIVNTAKDSMAKFKNLRFETVLDNVNGKVDLLHIGSTLQYVENWEVLLTDIVKNFEPSYLVFSDLLAGNIPSFVSHQLFYGKRIPCLFFNIGGFVEFISSLGFRILFKSKFINKILNQEEVFPNQALPKKYQIDRAASLVFGLK